MSNTIVRKLIVEQPNYDLEFVTEQQNSDAEKKLYLIGKMIMVNEVNKNNRIYKEEDMLPAIDAFKENFIKRNRGGGTLNHEASADIDLGKLCHKIVSLERDKSNPNFFVGKSMVLSTPSGKILESLIKDNMSFGMSSRAIGRVIEESSHNVVKDCIICSIDAVFEPSIGGGGSANDKSIGFVNGILENKEYIISDDGHVAEAFHTFTKSLAKYPSKHRDEINRHILEAFSKLLKSI